ncbi:histidine-type phosphatase [Rhizobium paknamense]|uniref:4-phytase/acid phosphatase n=1 Tax=Rhizobium paknamense TaxID=1206817 RepID=A0ABU0IF90_9HYPH|nr:histidine-type phosphatase [Rhizobium paknamense]MDQ0456917.1 4-phytase/acid phosphatase [Rhizobium paknamense]
MKAPRLLASLLLSFSFLPAVASAETLTLDKYVVMMRHGVRPQTSIKEIEPLSSKPWAKWDTPDGQLTPHGAEAASRLAAWDGAMLRERGLLPKEGCPAPGTVFGWANGSVKRTIDTGNVMFSTLFPGCGLTVGFNKTDDVDVLYAPSDTKLGAVDPEKAKAAILQAAGGDLEKPRARAAALMKELDGILDCCAPSLCDKAAKASDCTLSERPWAIKVKEAKGEKPASVEVTGPLKEAGTVVQVFLLQYANGFPADQVAFGKAPTADDIIRLSELRQIKYDVSVRVPYLAARDGSNILNQLLLAVEADPAKGAVTDGPPNARLVLFAGSDTQQAEIGAILGLHWHIPPYTDDETPPTGTLAFERLHDAAGKAYVRLRFIAPSLDQIRTAAVLDSAHPPLQGEIVMPGCESQMVEGACPLDTFLKLARPKLDMSAVGQQVYN